MINSYLDDKKAIERLKAEYLKHKQLIIGFDFDCTVYDYHKEKLELQPVINLLVECSKLGFIMCLYTVSLKDAELNIDSKVKYCKDILHINVHYINESPILTEQQIDIWHYKPFFNILLDDRAGLSSSYNILYTALSELGLL